MSRPSTTSTVRFRKSCDRCQAAKVKCSRVKPSCWRCSQEGYECVYGPFRATGRPSKSTKQDNGSSTSPRQSEAPNPTRERARNHNKESVAPMQHCEDTSFQQCQADFSQLDQASSTTTAEGDSSASWSYNALQIDLSAADFVAQDLALDLQDDASHDPIFGITSRPTDDMFSTTCIPDDTLSAWEADSRGWATGPTNVFDTGAAPPIIDTAIPPASSSAANTQEPSQITSATKALVDGPREARKPGNSQHQSRSRDDYSQALTSILAHLTSGSSDDEPASLDQLLNLDRQLRTVAHWVLTYLKDSSNGANHTITILLLMSLGNLLGQFEAQKDAATATCATSKVPKFLDERRQLQIGDFAVNENVKVVFQRQLVLDVLKNQQYIAQQLDRDAVPMMKGVNQKIAKELTADIERRVSLLRGWLKLPG